MIDQNSLQVWGDLVARSANKRSEITSYYQSLLFLFDNQAISDYQFCYCLSRPLSNDVVLRDEKLIDIATEASNYEVPDGNPAAVGDRPRHLEMLSNLINKL